ncbi:hypothetical protein ONZ45_g3042 [Pleurotus djamor]|nr:hypothetical protein ONZ45_g3042 [Pleurotus djamor]
MQVGDRTSSPSRGRPSRVAAIAYAPISLLLSLASGLVNFLRPFAPQIIPLLVCVLLVPLIILLSAYAGWVVWKSVPVAWQVPLNLQYGDAPQPYAMATIADISSQQPYDITLRLSVPPTDANFALGNFMASVDFFTPSNTSITSARRSAIVLPNSASSWLIRSSSSKLIDVDVFLLDSQVLGFSRVAVKVQLGRHDRWTSVGNGQARELSIASATLIGHVRHRGLRGLVSRFPFTFAVISAFTFLAINLLVVGACVLPMVITDESEHANTPQADVPRRVPVVSNEFDSSSGGDQKPPKSHRRTRTRRGSIRRMANNLFNVSGKVVLITGGSRGVGKMKRCKGAFSVSSLLQSLSCSLKVYISSRSVAQCDETARELKALGPGECISIPADLQKFEEVERLVKAISSQEPRLHVLVNNAGAAWEEPLDDYSDAGFTKVINLNLQRVFTLTQKLLPLLRAAAQESTVDGICNDPARVINIGSVEALTVPHHETYAYSASKAALHHLSRNLAGRLGWEGIVSNTIACGPFESRMTTLTLSRNNGAFVKGIPLRRIGRPEDVAGTALFLASPASSYVNGATVALDGGYLVAMPKL